MTLGSTDALRRDYIDMIEDNYLANAIFTTVRAKADFSKVKESRGDFQTSSLSSAVNNPENNTVTVQSWLARAHDRLSTLVFCVDIRHVADLTATFRYHGIDAKYVTAKTKLAERRERIEGFKAGKYPVLLNCGIFTEGTDIPNIDCVILARPTKSRNLLVQMLGRGLRSSPGKENCHVLDMVSSLQTGIVTTPTLFGLDPDEVVQDANLEDMKDIKERREAERLREDEEAAASPTIASGSKPGPQVDISFTDYDSVKDLIEDTSGERYIRAISPFAWVQIDEDRFILSDRSGGFLTLRHIVTNGAEHNVTITQKLSAAANSKSPYARPRQIASAPTFEGAVRAADTYAKEHFTYIFIHKNAVWRRREATEGQLAFLNRKRTEDDKLEAANVTKGKATDRITKIKHGAQGRFNRLASDRRKLEKAVQKREAFKEQFRKEQFKVGPVAA